MGLGRNKCCVCRVRHTSHTAETQLSLDARRIPDDDSPQLTVYAVSARTESRASGAHLPPVRFRFCFLSSRAPLGPTRRILFSGGPNSDQRTSAEVAVGLRDKRPWSTRRKRCLGVALIRCGSKSLRTHPLSPTSSRPLRHSTRVFWISMSELPIIAA
jgi:hypothetical protein